MTSKARRLGCDNVYEGGGLCVRFPTINVMTRKPVRPRPSSKPEFPVASLKTPRGLDVKYYSKLKQLPHNFGFVCDNLRGCTTKVISKYYLFVFRYDFLA